MPPVSEPSDPAVDRALRGLPVEQRAVVVLRLHLDWSVDDVAAAPDVSPGTQVPAGEPMGLRTALVSDELCDAFALLARRDEGTAVEDMAGRARPRVRHSRDRGRAHLVGHPGLGEPGDQGDDALAGHPVVPAVEQQWLRS